MKNLVTTFLLLLCAALPGRLFAQVATHTALEGGGSYPISADDILWAQEREVDRYVLAHPELLAKTPLRKTSWSFTVGSTASWYADDFTGGSRYAVPSTCRSVGTHCYIFVEDASWGSRVTQAEVDSVRHAFDDATPANPAVGIYQTDVDSFGSPPDVDGDARIIILILDIKDGFSGSGGFVAGYFTSYNELPISPSYPTSNVAEIYFLDCNPLNLGTANGLEDGMATTAHEFQHMIHWNYNKLGDTFTNEGCSLMAEVICGFPLYTQSLFEGEPNHYLFDWRRNNLTLALNDYSRAARFFLYLKEQFGAALLKTIVQTNLAGSERLDAALAAYSPPTARRFADIFQDWLLANSVNNRSVDTKWGYLSSSVATVLPIVFISPNVPSTGDTVANLGGLYLSFRAGMSLTTTIASGAPSGDFFLRAIEKGPSGVRVLPVTLGSPFSEPAFGSGYTDVTFLVGGINPSLPRNITYSSSGTDAAAELKWDETEPVGYLPIAAGDSVCVQFDGYAGARLDSVRVALRRTGSITGGIWRSSGVVQPTPLGTPLAVPIQVSGSMNPPTPYPVPWPNWGSADVHSLNIDASQPFVAAFACTGLPSVDNRIMVTLQAGSGPYHSFTTSSGSWVYYTNTTGDSLFLYMVRAYVSIPTGVGREAIELRPTSTGLFQNFPNPFNPSTKIRYTLAERRPVVLRVFDVLGRDVRTLVSEVQAPGTYETIWDGRDARGAPVTSGVYYYRLEAGPFTRTERMVFLK